jgi:hypothetical protein
MVATRQRLKALKAEEYVTRLVSTAPPLTDAQIARISAILQRGAGGG